MGVGETHHLQSPNREPGGFESLLITIAIQSTTSFNSHFSSATPEPSLLFVGAAPGLDRP